MEKLPCSPGGPESPSASPGRKRSPLADCRPAEVKGAAACRPPAERRRRVCAQRRANAHRLEETGSPSGGGRGELQVFCAISVKTPADPRLKDQPLQRDHTRDAGMKRVTRVTRSHRSGAGRREQRTEEARARQLGRPARQDSHVPKGGARVPPATHTQTGSPPTSGRPRRNLDTPTAERAVKFHPIWQWIVSYDTESTSNERKYVCILDFIKIKTFADQRTLSRKRKR